MKTHRFLPVTLVAISLVISVLACGSSSGGSTGGGSSDGGSGGGGETRDISGEYEVSGVNLSDQAYQGEATITRSGSDYAINWLIASSAQTGLGTLDGDTFTVTWSDGTYNGEATYTLQADGSLEGTWTQDGESGEGTETLTPK